MTASFRQLIDKLASIQGTVQTVAIYSYSLHLLQNNRPTHLSLGVLLSLPPLLLPPLPLPVIGQPSLSCSVLRSALTPSTTPPSRPTCVCSPAAAATAKIEIARSKLSNVILFKVPTWRHFCCCSASPETVTSCGSLATCFFSAVSDHCSRFCPPPPRYCCHCYAPSLR